MKSVDFTMSIRMKNLLASVVVQYMGWYLKLAGLVVTSYCGKIYSEANTVPGLHTLSQAHQSV
jgi:hypothetical protein